MDNKELRKFKGLPLIYWAAVPIYCLSGLVLILADAPVISYLFWGMGLLLVSYATYREIRFKE